MILTDSCVQRYLKFVSFCLLVLVFSCGSQNPFPENIKTRQGQLEVESKYILLIPETIECQTGVKCSFVTQLSIAEGVSDQVKFLAADLPTGSSYDLRGVFEWTPSSEIFKDSPELNEKAFKVFVIIENAEFDRQVLTAKSVNVIVKKKQE